MLSKSTIKFVRQLHQKKYRNEHKLFIVEGEKIVKELLTSSFTIHSVFGLASWVADSLGSNENFPVNIVNEKELEAISLLDAPNKVLAVVHQAGPAKEVSFREGVNYLLLDVIRDPGNLGTILRIADWFGIDAVILSMDCVEAYNPKVVQSSMGSIFRVNFMDCVLTEFLSKAKKSTEVTVYGATLEGMNLYDVKFGKSAILVIGNESDGLSENVRRHIDREVTIPSFNKMDSRPESLNAAIATAIFCSELRRGKDK